MNKQRSNFSSLSNNARLKCKILYYVSTVFPIALFANSYFKSHSLPSLPILGMCVLAMIGTWGARPSKLQLTINKLAQKGNFPLTKGGPKSLKRTLIFAMLMAGFYIFRDGVSILSVYGVVLHTLILACLFDQEITSFIWKKTT